MNRTGTSLHLLPVSPRETETLSQSAAHASACVSPIPEKALHSRLVQRLHRRYEDLLDLLPPGLPDHTAMRAVLAALHQQGHDTGAALRTLRRLLISAGRNSEKT